MALGIYPNFINMCVFSAVGLVYSDGHFVTAGRLEIYYICTLHVVGDGLFSHLDIAVPEGNGVVFDKLCRSADALLLLAFGRQGDFDGL